MSQHDMILDNGPGLAVRTDMNAAVQALASTNAGPTEPTTKYAGQFWLDTTTAPNGTVRMRNQANNAWIKLFDVVDSVPSDRLVSTPADMAMLFRTTPGNQLVVNDRPDGTGTDIMTLTDTGDLKVKGGRVLLQKTVVASNTATVSFDYWSPGWPSEYAQFELEIVDLKASATGGAPMLRVKTGNPGVIQAANYGWGLMGIGQGGTPVGDGATAAGSIGAVTIGLSRTTAASAGLNVAAGVTYRNTIRFPNPLAGAANYIFFRHEYMAVEGASGFIAVAGFGYGYLGGTITPITGVLIQLMNSVQIASGEFRLWGYKSS